MKKQLLLIAIMCYAFVSYGQVYLTQDFSGATMPPSGWTIDGYPAQWTKSATNKAGGVAPEARFKYVNVPNGTSRLISPIVDLTGINTVTLAFKHKYDFYEAGTSIGVATRFGTGEWTSVWEIETTENIGPETKMIELTGVGQANFQFCLYIKGNLYNVDYWYIDDIKLFIPLSLDAGLTSIKLPSYVAVNTSTKLTGKVTNQGSTPLTSFDIAYKVNDGAAKVYSITDINLPIGGTKEFEHSTPIEITGAGTYKVDVNIQNINGGADLNPENDKLTTYIGAVPFIPAKKVLAEEATGTWCGWCVRGTCFMEHMEETYPNWIGVAIHNGDPMVNTEYDAALSSIIPAFSGFPSATLDRSGTEAIDPSDFEAAYLEQIKAISPATIDITNYKWDNASRVVTFDLESEFVVDINNELRFGVIIVEDSLYGTEAKWAQANYYSGGAQGVMCGFETLANPIPAVDMVYNHVARKILDTPFGTPSSLPAGIKAGSTHSFSYTFTVPEAWRYDKLLFIGFVLDKSSGEILNSNDVISSYLGVEKNQLEQSITVFPNPAVDHNTNVEFSLSKSSVVKVEVCNYVGKTMYSESSRIYPSGKNKIKINSQNLSAGVYLVKLTIDNKTYTRKVSVVR